MNKLFVKLNIFIPVLLVLVVAASASLYAEEKGIAGRTLKTTNDGCGSCHGSSATSGVVVTISGPAALNLGAMGSYTVTVTDAAGNNGGVNIAVSSGALSPVSSTLKLDSGELVHNDKVAIPATYEFQYTAPATQGIVTMYAIAKGANFTAWNWASNFPIDVNDSVPVELSSFSATVQNNVVELLWTTATETNNFGFEIQRAIYRESEKEKMWVKIGFVNGHGTRTTPASYSFAEENPVGGSKLWYRLKQVDFDGTFEYSNEIEINLVPDDFSLLQNYPNPFNPSTTIQFRVPNSGFVSLKIYNLLGSEIATLINENLPAGQHKVTWDGKNQMGAQITTGVYFYQIKTPEFSQTKKMLLML